MPRKAKTETQSETTEQHTEAQPVERVEVIREQHDPKYVAGIPGKRDKYKIAESKATNLQKGDVPAWAVAKESDIESANAWQEQYGMYVLRDKNGKEIRNNELIAMGCPREEYNAKISSEMRQVSSRQRNLEAQARREGAFDGRTNPTNKKYFIG